ETRFSSDPGGEAARALVVALYNSRLGDAEFRQRLISLLESAVPRLLDPGALRELAARDVAFSSSALASFSQCPYLHFVEKWLRLKSLPGREVESLDLGIVLHAVLRECLESEGRIDPIESLGRQFASRLAGKPRSFRQRADYW